MNQERKSWVRPELTVVVRARPEEALLNACKELPGSTGGGGPSAQGNLSCFADGSSCNNPGNS